MDFEKQSGDENKQFSEELQGMLEKMQNLCQTKRNIFMPIDRCDVEDEYGCR